METTKEKTIEPVLHDLESIAEEIRLQLHLAGMEANDTWKRELEPRLFAARVHAQEAGVASKAAIDEALAALRAFRKTF